VVKDLLRGRGRGDVGGRGEKWGLWEGGVREGGDAPGDTAERGCRSLARRTRLVDYRHLRCRPQTPPDNPARTPVPAPPVRASLHTLLHVP